MIRGKRWEFAYYAAGYSVECALKSCVLARMIYTGGVFRDKDDWNPRDCLTHDLKTLVKLAGLDGELNARRDESAAAGGRFAANWNRVLGWKVTSRYEARTEGEARELFDAIAQNPDGVLRWVKKYW